MKFTGENKQEFEDVVNDINDFLDSKFDISNFEVKKFDKKN